MLKTFGLAMKFLWREWRAGEWFIVFIALLLAITATTSIHFFTDRLLRGLDQQSAKFLGGDLVISSTSPIPVAWKEQAKTLELRTAEVWSYPSVVSTKNQLQLVGLQAVSDEYPLFGDRSLHPDHQTIWVEPRLLPLLSINMNDMLTIGAANFRVQKVLNANIDTLNTGWIIAPRVLMRLDDVPTTRTVLPGSRIDYRLLLTGDVEKLQQFRQWITPQLSSGQHLLDVKNQQSALRTVFQRTENYIQLVLLVCLLMSGVAIALSIQQYLRRHYSHVALWRCLGVKRQQIIQIFFWQLTIIALTAGTLAIGLGYLAQEVFAYIFKDFLLFPIPAAGYAPILLGFITSILLLFAFAYPVINELPRTSPLYIWRDEVISNTWRDVCYSIIYWLAIAFFVYWFMNFSLLTFYFLYIIFLCAVFLFILSLILLTLLRFLLTKTEGSIRQGISQLVHHPKSMSLQFIGFNLILISLIVLGLVRSDLIENWKQSLTQQAPNYFAFNIAPTDITQLDKFFKQHDVQVEGIYPMVRGRLTALNGKPILSAVPKEAMNNNALHRDLNLSWMWQFPSDNKIVHGVGWTQEDHGKALASVENKLAEDLKLRLGDELTFQIGDKKISAVISNFRTVEWTSVHPNFFIIFPPGLLDKFPTTYITSFHLNADQTILLNQIVKQFPNITVIDVANILVQLQALIGKVILAIQYLFLFALAAGILIFITSLQASMDERRKTYSLLRVLGASNKYIRKSLAVEFTCLALLIISVSMGLAWLIVFWLEHYIFNL